MKHKIFTLFLVLAASTGITNAAVVNGTCGENLTWSLDTETNILKIEGEGEMYNYTSSYQPWSAYTDNIKEISLPNGLLNIGNCAFWYSSQLENVIIPNSVTTIGDYAFVGCNRLTSIDIPDGVQTIGSNAFSNCYTLSSVTIANSVISIGFRAFQHCSKLSTVTIGSDINQIGTQAFDRCSVTRLTIAAITPISATSCGINQLICTLFVPAESKELYATTDWWKDFKEIRSIGSLHVVKFLDWDGTILSSDEVDEGSAAIPPTNPTREGYTFIGWDKDFNNVTEDMTIMALYKINRYKVEFIDWDDTLLKSDSVDWNTAAIAPSEPLHRKGYTFKGWDKDFEHVTSDLTIKALYEMGEETDIIVRFTNGNNGNEILRHSIILKVPEAPEIEGFTFLGWQPVAELINDEIEIQAVYEADDQTSAPAEMVNPRNTAQKLIREGNVYILRDNATYTTTGVKVE